MKMNVIIFKYFKFDIELKSAVLIIVLFYTRIDIVIRTLLGNSY